MIVNQRQRTSAMCSEKDLVFTKPDLWSSLGQDRHLSALRWLVGFSPDSGPSSEAIALVSGLAGSSAHWTMAAEAEEECHKKS